MGHQYAAIAFTDQVKQQQTAHNSRSGYQAMESGEDYNGLFSREEADFIHARDSFYMASVSSTDWPYVQHRGGAAGFLKVLDAKTLGFADYSGNRQYISSGNFKTNDRVSLFLMDYPNRRRLKILGRIEQLDDANLEAQAALEDPHYRARIERSFIIKLEAFDWNCPQHITPRYDQAHLDRLLAPMETELEKLRRQLSNSTAHQSPSSELGEGPLSLVVSGIRQLTPRVRAVELRSPTGANLPKVEAGAHLQLPVWLNGKAELRHYSICSNPARRDIYEIAVLAEEIGESQQKEASGAHFIHQQYQLGRQIHCELPDNYFVTHTDNRPAVLIAGGIGITPIKAMLQSLKAQGNNVQLHYAGRQLNEMAFADRLARELGSAAHFYHGANQQRLDLNALLSQAPKDAIFYCCGPDRLLAELEKVALAFNIDPERIRTERFSAASHPAVENKAVTLTLARSKKIIAVSRDESLLDALLDNGVEMMHSCKTGQCRSCVVKVISGEAEHRDDVLSVADKNTGLICPCVSRAHSEGLTLDL